MGPGGCLKIIWFGGGVYIDPVFPPYDIRGLVRADQESALRKAVRATIPPPYAIDNYGILDPNEGKSIRSGDTVIFGFRIQAFVTRAFVVPISGISKGEPKIEGIWTPYGHKVKWPE